MKFLLIFLFFHLIYKISNIQDFICDNREKILSLSKVNDNFCDCKDGTDEITTNACENGRYTCENRFHLKKIIPTSRLDDGICDCCDGSDELKRKNCPNTCLIYTKIDFEQDQFILDKFVSIIKSYEKKAYVHYFENQINQLKGIISFFTEIEDLYKKKQIIASYIDHIRREIGEEEFERNDFYVDENEIVLIDLRKSLDSITEIIRNKEKQLYGKQEIINRYFKYLVFQDMEESCFDSKYKSYEVKLCLFKTIEYRGMKDNKYKTKNIGTFDRYENNVYYYRNGVKCGLYNKYTSGKLILQCGDENQLTFLKKNGCEYEFLYKTKLGCNTIWLNNLQGRIKQYFSELN